ncbi:transcription factor GTE7-like [Rutidosis leptorrhynchoides]|uniref:transcription factor GTE7-like n=1 Tax=Rutidosis leptorrhynchoides TaxID=125765 RepID=UPI003A9A5625
MASAVLANRSETDWPRSGGGGGGNGGAKFMGKLPFSNQKIPNPNPEFSKKRQFHQTVVNNYNNHNGDIDESPIVTQSGALDDASSINRKPSGRGQGGEFSGRGYVDFSISSYSKKGLTELKDRLISELEQIRGLRGRIESHQIQSRSAPHNKKSSNKKFAGNKRPLPVPAAVNPENATMLKNCAQILTKLMKHKFGYIFNSPVDVVGMNLHDYYDIVKTPMDLGTVKSNMSKNLYESPVEFAADVRLTFNNAMMYNPKGHHVYNLAEQLLAKFEELYWPVGDKLKAVEEMVVDDHHHRVYEEEVQASSWNRIEPQTQRDDDNIVMSEAKSEPLQGAPVASGSNQNQPLSAAPVRTPSPVKVPLVKPLKQPKPKAKDPNKREMTMEEKHKLGLGLQSLPQEKMEQVVQIIRKRNGHLTQDGDEIELDIEAVDTETLWELDRFVTNYKKMVSKIKRQALMGTNMVANDGSREFPMSEKMDVAIEPKKSKKLDAGEEDVDIGDEMPMSSFPPVEIEKDNGHVSGSSSSSSSSGSDSSSSDSDSGSSSGSESDDARS